MLPTAPQVAAAVALLREQAETRTRRARWHTGAERDRLADEALAFDPVAAWRAAPIPTPEDR